MSDTPRTDKWLAVCIQEHSMVVCARAFERELATLNARIQTIADEAFGPFPRITATEALDEIETGIHEYKRDVAVALSALERLRDCDWVITPHDRMDAVRDIARDAIAAIHNSSNPGRQPPAP